MIDFQVCITGFCLGLSVCAVGSLLNMIISAFARVMRG